MRHSLHSRGKSLSAGTLPLTDIDYASILATLAAVNAPKPKRSPVPHDAGHCELAKRAADAMRLAMQPPPFGDETIAARRLARAHALRGEALNARACGTQAEAPAIDRLSGHALAQHFATLRRA